MKRLFTLSLIFCLLTALLSVVACPSVAATGALLFDEDHIVLSFGAISDIHILSDAEHAATQKYATALRLLKKHAGGNLDAVTIAGDISNSSYESGIGEAFKTITDAELGADANVFFVTGNHDAQNDQWDTLHQIYADLAKYTAKDLPSSQHDRGNRHMVVGGYHYIGVNMMDYWNASEAMFADEDLQWLSRELAAARADAPGKPIFVYMHAPAYGTTYGSDLYTGCYWGSKKIHSYLAQYPEVVTFSGHLHFPIHDSRTIYQKDFTALNCGSVQYMSVENGLLQSGSQTTVSESGSISNGLLVQVDKNNNLKITRLDFANDAVIGDPLYVLKGDLTTHNPDHIALGNTAPQFGEHAGVSGYPVGENLEVTFDAAADNDMVHHYSIEIKSLPSGIIKQVDAFSEFYFYPTADEMPLAYSLQIPYTLPANDTTYEITLCAVDSYGLASAPLSFTYNSADKPPVITGVESGGTYYTTQKVTVTDDNLDKVLLNGKLVTGFENFGLMGNQDTTYTVVAIDKGGNRTAVVAHMRPVTDLAADLRGITEENVTFTEVLLIERVIGRIDKLSVGANSSDLTALNELKADLEALIARVDASTEALNTAAIEAVRDITADTATEEDAENLLAALADYEAALVTYAGNYGQETKDAIAEEVARVEAALRAVGIEWPTTTAPTPTAPAEETGEGEAEAPSFPWLYGGIGLAVALLVGGTLWFLLRKKK